MEWMGKLGPPTLLKNVNFKTNVCISIYDATLLSIPGLKISKWQSALCALDQEPVGW